MKRRFTGRNKSRPSLEIIGQIFAVGELLVSGGATNGIQTADGVPKVIPIYGKGATFERLARKCAPGIHVKHCPRHSLAPV